MMPASKAELSDQITRTYWSFWLWLSLTFLAVVNMTMVPSIFAGIVIIINLYVLITRYQEHKKFRAEYERKYSWPTHSSVDQSKETE